MTDEAKPATVEFKGQTFTLNDELSEWALLEFAEAADSGADGNELAGAAALLRFVVELIHPDDRARFRAVARRERAKAEDLVALLMGRVEEQAERPTGRSSDSSDGPESTELKSDANSGDKPSPASGLLNGRPDLQLMIERRPALAG